MASESSRLERLIKRYEIEDIENLYNFINVKYVRDTISGLKAFLLVSKYDIFEWDKIRRKNIKIDISIRRMGDDLYLITLYRTEKQIQCAFIATKVENNIKKVDAIATDPPYGRSATTNREELSSLYNRAFETFKMILKPKGYISILLPDEESIKIGEKYLNLKESYAMRVHKSLTRNFCVYQKE